MTINHRFGDIEAVAATICARSLPGGRGFGGGQTVRAASSNMVSTGNAEGSSRA